MCTRSEGRVMQFAAWMNTAWWSMFIRVCIAHWPLHLWFVWHQIVKFCYQISTLFYFLLSHLTITGKTISSLLIFSQLDLESRTFAWPARPLHMHRKIILFHNLISEIQQSLTQSKINTQCDFQSDMSSKLTIWQSIPPLTQEPSRFHRPNPVSLL